MTSFTFTTEQIRTAPPEVRRWIEQEIAAAFRSLEAPAPEPAESPKLAACTGAEALQVVEMIRHDLAASQVFLELGRRPPIGSTAPLYALDIGEMQRHLRLSEDRLAESFGLINRSFMGVRNDPEAALFGFDKTNHVYIHEITHHSIRGLWEQLVRPHSPAEALGANAPHSFAFRPPVVGPSEDVAGH